MRSSSAMVSPECALAGRSTPVVVSRAHLTFGVSMIEPEPDGTETAYLAMGCFWGAERRFFELPGVVMTVVGYQGGYTANPTYEEVCTGRTGHAETVKVVFDPLQVSYAEILRCFYEGHNPTQGHRQGADIGTQYRSAIYYTSDRQAATAGEVTSKYATTLHEAGYGDITTEIVPARPFYMAEEYHQQYLVANPHGYCGLGGTGVSCPVGLAAD